MIGKFTIIYIFLYVQKADKTVVFEVSGLLHIKAYLTRRTNQWSIPMGWFGNITITLLLMTGRTEAKVVSSMCVLNQVFIDIPSQQFVGPETK